MSTKPPPSFSSITTKSGLTLEQRVEALEKAIKVTDDGVYISTQKLHCKALTIELESAVSVVIKGTSVEVNGAANLMLQGGATASLKAGIVKLNNGNHPVAHVGSKVIPHFPPFHKVDSGNGTVLA
jgi:hypothetical protein